MKKQESSAKTSRFQLQLIIKVGKYDNSTYSSSFAINCHFALFNCEIHEKTGFFDVKLVFSTKGACSWYVIVELNECYRMRLVLCESDEFSKSYHQRNIKFFIRESSISSKNSRLQRKLLDSKYN